MSEFKGTPGPWNWGEDQERDRFWIHQADGAPYTHYYSDVGNTCGGDPMEIQKANAQLMAAAPDLLQALMQMIETYPYSPPCHGWEAQVQAHKRAKEAIAKALGQ